MYTSLTWVSGLLLFASAAQAFDRQHDSHEHGVAKMLVALEGNELQLVLESPAANFAGFEHAPRTEAQRQTLAQVAMQLKTPEMVLTLPAAAGCAVELTSLEHSLDKESHDHVEHGHDGHDHDEHKGHDHDEHSHDEHAHDEHKGHDHDEHSHGEHEHKDHDHDEHHADKHSGHDHGDQESHSEYRLEYHFECSDPAVLDSIEINLFKHFALLHDLDVNYIGPNGQGAAALNAENPRFSF